MLSSTPEKDAIYKKYYDSYHPQQSKTSGGNNDPAKVEAPESTNMWQQQPTQEDINEDITPQYTYKKPDYTPLINDYYGNVKNSLLAKLRANKLAAQAQYANQADLARQSGFQALNDNDIQKAKSIQQLRSAMEASGQYGGGENVSANVAIGTQAQQNANDINKQVMNTVNDIQTQNDLIDKQAADNQLAIESDVGAQQGQALLNAADKEYQMSKDEIDRMDRLAQIDTANKQWQTSYDADQKWKDFNARMQEQETLWQKNPDNPAVQGQIISNKAALIANQLAEMEIRNYPEEEKLKLQQLKKQISQIGATPAMTQYDIDIKKAQLDQIKAETSKIREEANTAKYDNPYYVTPEKKIDSMKASGKTSDDIERYILNGGFSQNYMTQLYGYAGIPMR
jgi:hypothetical protein